MSLPRLPFGRTGLAVSPLGIGALDQSHGEDVIVRQMNLLLDAGANLVDTAQCYGGSEDLIGRHFAGRRSEFVLVSKCGHHDVLPDGRMRSRAITMDDVDGALRRLRTDHLDAMLLHSTDYDVLVQGDALAVLEQARTAGKILHLGYSGDNERLAWAAQCPLISVVECSVSLADQANLAQAIPDAQARGAGVIAKRPVANAAWRHAADPAQAPEHHRAYSWRLARMGLTAEEFGCDSLPELALRFTISAPGVGTAIVSSANRHHLEDNVRAATAGPLAPEAVAEIRRRFLAAEAESGGTWLAGN